MTALTTTVDLPPGTWFIVDPVTMTILFVFTVLFFVLFAKDLIIFFIMGVGKHLRTLISASIKKRPIDIEADDGGRLDFVLSKMSGESALVRERKVQGVKYTEGKLVPKADNPIWGKRYHLRGTGIPLFLSHAGAAIAANPDMLALMTISEEKDVYDPTIQLWLEKVVRGIPEKKDREKIVSKTVKGQKWPVITRKGRKALVIKRLLTLNPGKLKGWLEKQPIYNLGQFRIMMKQERIRGREERVGGNAVKGILTFVIVFGVILVIVMFVLPAFMGGQTTPAGGGI